MPILNERDLKTARSRISQLEDALGPKAVIQNLAAHIPVGVSSAHQKALKSELERLRTDVDAYEKLRGSNSAEHNDIDAGDLGFLPILARIARGISQRELADILELKEQQIQRYESERYSSVGLSRYRQILSVLGVELQPKLLPKWNAGPNDEKELLSTEVNPALLRELRNRGWFAAATNQDATLQAISELLKQGDRLSRNKVLHKKNNRANADLDELALSLWRARVLLLASIKRGKLPTKFNLADRGWVKDLVSMSKEDSAPARVENFLREHGIIFVIEQHLPKTHLDGGALMLSDGTPVVALTLRHDRLDNFWFVLFHELGHIFLHFNHGLEIGFTDDLDTASNDERENEADAFAQTSLVPEEIWNTSSVRFTKSMDAVRRFASANSVSPAIVVGRLRKERSDYSLFSKNVGQGTVRQMLGLTW